MRVLLLWLSFGLVGTAGHVGAQALPPGLPPELAQPTPAPEPTAQPTAPATEAVKPGGGEVAVPAPAAGAAPNRDEATIPERIPVDHYQTLWQRSPFELSIQSTNAAPTGIAADWLLTSLSRVDGQPVAILFNKTTNETVVAKTKDTGLHGLRVVSAQISPDYRQSKVRIARGGEEAELVFQENDLTSLAQLAPVQAPAPAVPTIPGMGIPSPSIQPGGNLPSTTPRPPRRIIVRPKPVTPPPNT